jgi:hypothetical protein
MAVFSWSCDDLVGLACALSSGWLPGGFAFGITSTVRTLAVCSIRHGPPGPVGTQVTA